MYRKDLSTAERNSIIQFLLQHSKNGKPARGKIQEAVTKFSSSRRTVSRLWAEAKKQQENNECINSTNKKKCAPRKKRVQLDIEAIQSLPLSKRSTIRSLASGINRKKSTVARWINQGLIKSHTSAIKPDLSTSNKLLRVRFSLEAVEYDRILNVFKFKSMHNTVHIDEKWFYITKGSHKFYITKEEAEPHRTCKSEKIIAKVMFMCAVCRPTFNADGSVLFDGKIGIFPFTEMVPAQRNSKNRGAGTLEQKLIPSINKSVIKECVINQILPAIKSKWPEAARKVIYIQQDNARPHIKDADPDFRAAASSDGYDIKIVYQPPNSPDTNINDLGWFRAIQNIQTESVCLNTNDLVTAVTESFNTLEATKLNKVFLTLQSCMLEIMKLKGQNSYKIPHLKKDALASENMLPFTLEVPTALVQESIDYLIEKWAVDEIDSLMQQLGVNKLYEALITVIL